MRMLVPPYAAGVHATIVADVHAELLQASVVVRDAVGVTTNPPKLRPVIVTKPPDVTATFAGAVALTHGAAARRQSRALATTRHGTDAPSKLNCPVSVPATALTLMAVRGAAKPPYASGAHATLVADVHALLPHASAAVSEAVGVKAGLPKLSPFIVTIPLAEGAALAEAALTTGAATTELDGRALAAQRGTSERTVESEDSARGVIANLDPRLATHTCKERGPFVHAGGGAGAERVSAAPLARLAAGAAQVRPVNDVQHVVTHGRPPAYADGVVSAVPNLTPRIVSAAPPETGTLGGEKAVAARANVGLGVGGLVGLSVQEVRGYAVWKVGPHRLYIPLLMVHERPVAKANASWKFDTRNTFHAAMFVLNAYAA